MINLQGLQSSTVQMGEFVNKDTNNYAYWPLRKSGMKKPIFERKSIAVYHKSCRGQNKHVEEGAMGSYDLD